MLSKKIASLVAEKSGRAYFVGGYVRDYVRGVENKDIDMEIHGLNKKELEEILDSVGTRTEYGKSFGIYGIKGFNIDIAMPRTEKRTGTGHRDFDIEVNPFIGTKKAAERRDFTINSLMQDVLTGEILDYFGGLSDIENKTIRHTNPAKFSEDPLRVLRAAQFCARFNYNVATETTELCSKIKLSDLSAERVNEELKKALLKSDKPSRFFEFLKSANKLDEWFVELKNLIDVKQNPAFHPEGDVWTHTMITLDSCVKFRKHSENPYGFMLLALCHDMGKAVCTSEKNGVIHSYKHEFYGLDIAEKFLRRLTNEKDLIKYVLIMTENHMKPFVLSMNNSSVKSSNKMFDSVISGTDIINFSLADNSGKEGTLEYSKCNEFLFDRLKIYNEIMARPHVTGADLVSLGITPGRNFREILNFTHKLRLAGIEKETALKEAVSYSKKLQKNAEE